MFICKQLKRIGFIGFFFSLICTMPLLAGEAGLLGVSNLKTLGAMANTSQTLIILMVSREECPYCDLIKREILKPMLLDKSDKRAYLIRELYVDTGENVIDFKGRLRPSESIAHDYRSSLTPTLLFLDGNGQPLHEKIIGIATPSLYPLYLDDAIDRSIFMLKGTR